MISSDLFTHDSEGTPCRYGVPAALDQHPLPPPPVKTPGPAIQLTQDPLPGAKVEAAIGHRDHRCASRSMTCKVQPVFAARFRCASALCPHSSRDRTHRCGGVGTGWSVREAQAPLQPPFMVLVQDSDSGSPETHCSRVRTPLAVFLGGTTNTPQPEQT
jgi:hypothetical protein